MQRRLGELLDGIVPLPDAATCARPVCGVYDDSRRVRPGGVFVAVRGTRMDGRRFVQEAVARGAVFVVGEELAPIPGVPTVEVPDARLVLARLAARWYGLDDRGNAGLRLAGVTGTNGKTTTAMLTQAILHAAGEKCGLIGTVVYDLVEEHLSAGNTTPGPLELAAHLATCIRRGAKFAVLEVSSHALDQKRTAGLRFAAAAFTNLTGDHLDYHKTFEQYRACKARLFADLSPEAVAVVNRDDPNAEAVTGTTRARQMGFSLDGPADITAAIERLDLTGTRYRLRLPDGEQVVTSRLIGRHNVANALAAAGLAAALGVPPEVIGVGLRSLERVPGRLERVASAGGREVFVDYAHTDDALRRALEALRPLTPGRLIVVFGCGGERDRSKRPRMAAVAERLADVVIVTSDNPRREPPAQIIAEIMAGFSRAGRRRVRVEEDRAAAIRLAVQEGLAGDVVLIAGKGHEREQVIGTQRLAFEDAAVARAAVAEAGLQEGKRA